MSDDLNERQRRYLLAAYKTDQAYEEAHKRAFQRGDYDESRRPASDWRAMAFGVLHGIGGAVPTMLRNECKGDVDEGSGSTWAALERRELLSVKDQEVRYHPGQILPHITLTPKGRKLARELKGDKAPTKQKGEVSRSTWKALVAGWIAGEAGLWDERGGDWYGGVSGDTWLMLTRRTKQRAAWFTDVQRRAAEGQPASFGGFQYGVKITPAGIAKYWDSWEVNRAKYPDIDAPNPRMRTREQREQDDD
ncbi:hypothetical protein [Deinococcus sp.]|uniref:hypothetical protein n=1 Tax=Deinococcus sp. TaxID=47478 RepID=UPI0025C09A02|nr:hypothetical protein [Deinococcus sp.]